jgi:four helix bundle protein
MADYKNLADDSKQTRNEMLERRMLLFAANLIRELNKHSILPKSVVNQLTRSAASVGANYSEACNASSKKEAAESRYWIDLCIELTNAESWEIHRKEAQELLLILQTIINTLKAKSAT